MFKVLLVVFLVVGCAEVATIPSDMDLFDGRAESHQGSSTGSAPTDKVPSDSQMDPVDSNLRVELLSAYVSPSQVSFGSVKVGQLKELPLSIVNDGQVDAVVQSIVKSSGSSDDFTINFDEGGEPTPDFPLVISPGQSHNFRIRYVASQESPGTDGEPALDSALFEFVVQDMVESLSLAVTGLRTSCDCPIPNIVAAEGGTVLPQTQLNLEATFPESNAADVIGWEWSVSQPNGSSSQFLPSNFVPNPSFEANVVGEYVFELKAWNESGQPCSVSAFYSVQVMPESGIHVELLWDTPSDPDQSDEGPEAGADMDLHFAKEQFASNGPDLDDDGLPDVWFDQPFDCFWFNPQPNWGSFDPNAGDNPTLDRDDTDGSGPEILSLDTPENNVTYRVGVHSWSDHGYGPSFATVRVFIFGKLVFEITGAQLANHDMWDVLTIDWPSGDVSVVEQEGQLKITPDYQNPFFFQP